MVSTKLLNLVIIISISTILVLFLTENQFFMTKQNITNKAVSNPDLPPTNSISLTPIAEICDESYLPPIGKINSYVAKTPERSFKYSLKRLPSNENRLIFEVDNNKENIIQNDCKDYFITGIAPIQALNFIKPLSPPSKAPNDSNRVSLMSSLEDIHLLPNKTDITSSWSSRLKIPTGIKFFGLEFVDLDIKHTPTITESKSDELAVEVSIDMKSSQLITKFFNENTEMKIDKPIIFYKMKKNIGITKFVLNSDSKKSAQLEINLVAN